jgi:hypothetical protein
MISKSHAASAANVKTSSQRSRFKKPNKQMHQPMTPLQHITPEGSYTPPEH